MTNLTSTFQAQITGLQFISTLAVMLDKAELNSSKRLLFVNFQVNTGKMPYNLQYNCIY